MPGRVFRTNQNQAGHLVVPCVLLWDWQTKSILITGSRPTCCRAVCSNLEEGSTARRGGAARLDTSVQGDGIAVDGEVDEGGVAGADGHRGGEHLVEEVWTGGGGRQGERRLKRRIREKSEIIFENSLRNLPSPHFEEKKEVATQKG